jgi:RNA polymerase sigma-70 factor (ECF subfamily)
VTATRSAHDAVERAARESYGKLVAYLARRCGSVGVAEDALSDAFAVALERWPIDGVPRAPDAWLLVAARNRFFDRARGDRRAGLMHERLVLAAREAQHALDESPELGDERLGLMFACAHPAIDTDIRAPLILQTILGIDAARIASAFLISPKAMSQRLVRAKHKIAAAKIPLHMPRADDITERLGAVLDAVYAAFSQGWDDPVAADPRTRGLAIEALWLGTTVARLCPTEPEALGLLALMRYTDARDRARRDESGAYVPLDEQDAARWDREAIDEAEALLARAATLRRIGRFQLEAAIASAHMVRRFRIAADRDAIVALYDALLTHTNSPVVALNRAVAIGYVRGPSAALAELDVVASDARLVTYQPYWAARADLLAKSDRREEAAAAYVRAIGLTIDPAARTFLEGRLRGMNAAKTTRTG